MTAKEDSPVSIYIGPEHYSYTKLHPQPQKQPSERLQYLVLAYGNMCIKDDRKERTAHTTFPSILSNIKQRETWTKEQE